jgi:hypothetical protein
MLQPVLDEARRFKALKSEMIHSRAPTLRSALDPPTSPCQT